MNNRYKVLLLLLAVLLAGIGWAWFFKAPSMIVIIPSYNNAEWCERNLSSVFNQTYTDYAVIYIDDNSTDDTYTRVLETVKKAGKSSSVRVIKNSERKGALANIYMAIHTYCPDNTIVVLLDGDDWLKHSNVLTIVATAYDDNKVWMTYGQDEMYPDGGNHHSYELPQYIIAHNAYRKYPWMTSHLRTFRSWLFKKIEKNDLMYEGNFFSVTWDMAILFPMLEMAAGRIKFIPDILYVYNTATPLNDFKTKFELQQKCNYYIRNKLPYAAL